MMRNTQNYCFFFFVFLFLFFFGICRSKEVGMLISLWLFLFSYLQHNQRIILGLAKDIRTTKS
jgi:hypothetical protein